MSNILPVFLPFAACGNKCTFCDQNIISGVGDQEDIFASVVTQIEKWKSINSSWGEVAFFGGNFAALPHITRQKLFKIARCYGLENIRYSTRPDTITQEIIDEIKGEGINFVELGIQSLNDEALRLNGRPYSSKEAIEAVEMVADSTNCGVQLMTGMFGQPLQSCLDDGERLSSMGVKSARIYPTVVIRGTPLETLFLEGRYVPPSLAETLLAAGGVYIYFISAGVPVIRMGLPLDGDVESSAVAGIAHPAFGDLVKTFVAALYAEIGEKVGFAGYKGFLRKNFANNFDGNNVADFEEVCKKVRRHYFEDNRGYLEGQAAIIAHKLESAAYNR